MSRRNRNPAAPPAGDTSLPGGAGTGTDEPLDDTIEGPEGDAGEEATPEPLSVQERAELKRLRAELKRLRAELAALKAPAAAPPPPAGLKRFQVSLKHVPARVVEAADDANAREAYKLAAGVLSSEHPFEVAPVGDDVPVGPCA